MSASEFNSWDFDPRLCGVGWTAAEAELVDCEPVVSDAKVYAALYSLGIRGKAITGAGPFDSLGCAPVVFLPNGRFEFARNLVDASGHEMAVVVPASDETGQTVDLVAVDLELKRPALWRGSASMLGQNNLYLPRLGEPLLVFESIADWLRGERRGVVVLHPQRAAPLLWTAQPLAVTSGSYGRRLRASLALGAPRILVAQAAGRAA